MTSISLRLLAALFAVLVTPLTLAQNAEPLIPSAPTIEAKSWLLLDFQSRQIIVSRAPDERIEPASLTKLMTAYLVFDALKQKRLTMDQFVPVSEKAWRAEGSRMFIEPRVPVSVEELLKGMIVQSGNDATIALAEAVGGTEGAFAELMNKMSARLGLSKSHFMNSTGLPDPQHFSTARDLATLASSLIRDFPEYFPLYSIKEYRYNNITQYNRNRLLGTDPYVDGLKTGFTESAGYCLIATAKRDPRRLLSVVLGTASDSARAQESQKLLNYGFQFYETVKVYSARQAISSIPVYKGSLKSVNAGFMEDLNMSLPRGSGQRLKAEMESMQPLIAPISAGQRVGTLRLSLDGKPLGDYPVVALDDVVAGNLISRMWDSIRLMVK